MDNHGDLTAPLWQFMGGIPNTCRNPNPVGNIVPSLLMNTVQAGPHPQFPNRARPIQTGHSKFRYPPKALA